jgi:hypothetical protein
VVDAIDTGDKFVNELDTHLEVIDPATSKTDRQAADAADRRPAATPPTSGSRSYGSYLLKAVHQRDGKTVAESLGSVAMSYPLEYLRTTPDPEPLRHAAQVSGGRDQAQPAEIWDPGKEKVSYTQDLWPWVLLGVVGPVPPRPLRQARSSVRLPDDQVPVALRNGRASAHVQSIAARPRRMIACFARPRRASIRGDRRGTALHSFGDRVESGDQPASGSAAAATTGAVARATTASEEPPLNPPPRSSHYLLERIRPRFRE